MTLKGFGGGPVARRSGRLHTVADRNARCQRGSFIWADPACDLALVVLTDRDFDDWAKPLWPALADGVLAEFKSD